MGKQLKMCLISLSYEILCVRYYDVDWWTAVSLSNVSGENGTPTPNAYFCEDINCHKCEYVCGTHWDLKAYIKGVHEKIKIVITANITLPQIKN